MKTNFTWFLMFLGVLMLILGGNIKDTRADISKSASVDAGDNGSKLDTNQVDKLAQPVDSQHQDPFSLARVLRTVFSLIFVCALAVLMLGKVIPKLNLEHFATRKGRKVPQKKLRIRERLVLDRKNYLALISVGESCDLLVGVGENGVSVLCTSDDTQSLQMTEMLKAESQEKFEPSDISSSVANA